MVARYIISPARRGKSGTAIPQPQATPVSQDSAVSLTSSGSNDLNMLTSSLISTASTIHDAASAPVPDINGNDYSAGPGSDRASMDLPATTTLPTPLSPSDRILSVFSFSLWRRFVTGSDEYTEPVAPIPAPMSSSLDGQSQPLSERSGAQHSKVGLGFMSKQHQLLSSTLATSISTAPKRQTIVGAGGTSAMQFIKQARDNTTKVFL
ncbi:hypothetical protein H4R34_005750 [Dimargaris verticillata]|uniref:Uncharacterized protein n=1 Tax=Dimargaris verticillata TaxID=2761393 RepID=A0A9W8B001_9FUNG|nr:hypothetical protein H4R34_005750 [Dimargaris verticillata]